MPEETYDFTDRAAAAASALTAPLDLTGAAVEPAGGPQAKVVVSARVSPAYSAWIVSAAASGQITPSALTAELIGEAIAARIAAAGGGVPAARRVVFLDDVHRVIDQLAA